MNSDEAERMGGLAGRKRAHNERLAGLAVLSEAAGSSAQHSGGSSVAFAQRGGNTKRSRTSSVVAPQSEQYTVNGAGAQRAAALLAARAAAAAAAASATSQHPPEDPVQGLSRTLAHEPTQQLPGTDAEMVEQIAGGQPQALQCSVCNKTFTRRNNLRRHFAAVHQKVRRFECPTCKKRFSRHSDLQTHIQTVHRRIRAFQCEICQKSFFQSSHLSAHRRLVHNEKKGKRGKDTPAAVDGMATAAAAAAAASARGGSAVSIGTQRGDRGVAIHQSYASPSADTGLAPTVRAGAAIDSPGPAEAGALGVRAAARTAQQQSQTAAAAAAAAAAAVAVAAQSAMPASKRRAVAPAPASASTQSQPEAQLAGGRDSVPSEGAVSRARRSGKRPAQPGRFACPDCGIAFTQQGSMMRHIRTTHARVPMMTCNECDKSFSRKENYQRHLVRVHRADPVEAKIRAQQKLAEARRREGVPAVPRGRRRKHHPPPVSGVRSAAQQLPGAFVMAATAVTHPSPSTSSGYNIHSSSSSSSSSGGHRTRGLGSEGAGGPQRPVQLHQQRAAAIGFSAASGGGAAQLEYGRQVGGPRGMQMHPASAVDSIVEAYSAPGGAPPALGLTTGLGGQMQYHAQQLPSVEQAAGGQGQSIAASQSFASAAAVAAQAAAAAAQATSEMHR